jgi:hypothetical protein
MNIFGLFAVLSSLLYSTDVAIVAPGEPSSFQQQLQNVTPLGSVMGAEVDNVSAYGDNFHGTPSYSIFFCFLLNLHSLHVFTLLYSLLNVFTLGSSPTSWKLLFQDLIISSFQASSMFAAMLTLDVFGVTMLSSTFPPQLTGETLNMDATGNFLQT